ncbi:MAG: Polyketide cyclase / dehydrase and lipid transport [Planctomycetota bacterium]|jgi:hypothetical protein
MLRPWTLLCFLLAGFAAIFLGIGALIPDGWEVRTVRTVAAPPAAVRDVLGDLASWPQWCTLAPVMGPNTASGTSAPKAAEGVHLWWRGARGESRLTFTATSDTALAYRFGIEGAPQLGTGALELSPGADGSTQVAWVDRGSFPTLAARWAGWFGALQEAVRATQEESLGNLVSRLGPGQAR